MKRAAYSVAAIACTSVAALSVVLSIPDDPSAANVIPWVPVVQGVAALGSSMLALWTALRVSKFDEVSNALLACLLGIGLASSSHAYGLLLSDSPFEGGGIGATAFVVGATLAVAGLARFAVFFPSPLTALQLNTSRPGRKPVFEKKDAEWLLRILQANRYWASILSLLGTLIAVMALFGLMRGPASASLMLGMTLLTGAAAFTGLFIVAALIEASYWAREGVHRARLIWVRWGFLLFLGAFLVSGAGWTLGALGLAYEWVLWFAFGAIGLIPLILVGTLWIAVFYDGAIDPHLAIRQTTVYGSLAVLLLFAFNAIESLIGNILLSRIGLSEGNGVWMTGGVIALTFQPLQVAVRGRVDAWMDDKLPATDLAEAPRHQAVIVFSDIVGYSALTSENEDDALTMMSVFHRQARRAAERSKGRLVKTMGDGVIMEFKDAPSAVTASQHLASSFRDACETLGLPEGRLRTGIHFGEVAKRRDGDLFGDAVNIASRLESEAEPGQIVVSQVVADQLEGGDLEDLGERSLKNVPEPVRCWAVKT